MDDRVQSDGSGIVNRTGHSNRPWTVDGRVTVSGEKDGPSGAAKGTGGDEDDVGGEGDAASSAGTDDPTAAFFFREPAMMVSTTVGQEQQQRWGAS